MTKSTDLIAEAKKAVNEAQRCEAWAVEAYCRAYGESIQRVEEGSIVLYATQDGADDGPLPFALELNDGNNGCDPDAVFLYRDGDPTCPHFFIEEAKQAIESGKTPALGALAFVRQIVTEEGRVCFLDGQQAAGLLLAVLGQEGR